MNNELQNRDAQSKKGIYSDDFSNTAQSDIYHAEWDARVNELGKFASPDRSALSTPLEVDTGSSDASFFGSLALLPGSEQMVLEQSDWSEERNINPYAVFEKPPAMLQVTPNIGRRGQTGIALTGINFTPDRSGIVLRCDGRVMASNLISDDAGRVTASFTVPTEARNGNRIVEMADGQYTTRASLQINDPLVITRIQRFIQTNIITRIVRVPVVRTATLGKTGRQGIITHQTYAEGVLLESSNAEIWTPLNGSDLNMKLYGYEFENEGTVQFQPVSGVQFSDLNIDEYSAIPEGTHLIWEYSTDGEVTWDAVVPAEEERLPNLANGVLVRVRFSTGMGNDTPALNFRDVNLIGYLNNTTGTYLTRENELTQGVESTKVYTQMDIPSGTSVQWFASNDGGETWEAMTIDDTRPINEDWIEYTLVRTFSDP